MGTIATAVTQDLGGLHRFHYEHIFDLATAAINYTYLGTGFAVNAMNEFSYYTTYIVSVGGFSLDNTLLPYTATYIDLGDIAFASYPATVYGILFYEVSNSLPLLLSSITDGVDASNGLKLDSPPDRIIYRLRSSVDY